MKIQIEETISEGVFGTICRGIAKDNRRIIVKSRVLYSPSGSIYPDHQRTFRALNEEKILSHIKLNYERHSVLEKHTAAYLGCNLTDGRLHLYFKDYELGNLRDYLKDGRGLKHTERTRYECCRQLAGGLKFLHEIGVLHRTLRPENIFLSASSSSSPSGAKLRCKIGGFGAAAMLPYPTNTDAEASDENWDTDQDAHPPKFTILDESSGSMGLAECFEIEEKDKKIFSCHSAPELVSHPHSKPTDVYALGMLMCELMTGTMGYSDFFHINNLMIRGHKFQEINPAKELDACRKIPKMFKALVLNMVHPSPKERPEMTSSFLRHLDAQKTYFVDCKRDDAGYDGLETEKNMYKDLNDQLKAIDELSNFRFYRVLDTSTPRTLSCSSRIKYIWYKPSDIDYSLPANKAFYQKPLHIERQFESLKKTTMAYTPTPSTMVVINNNNWPNTNPNSIFFHE